MRYRLLTCILAVSVIALVGLAEMPRAQTAARPAARPATTANVQQVMRGILFPAANVVFFGQSNDPAAVKPAADPSIATDPLASTYGGWNALANSGLALAESARLLEVARPCANGKPAPIQSATWKRGLAQLRAAGLASYQAAQKKDQDAVLDASDKVTEACSTCHETYREKTPRCVG